VGYFRYKKNQFCVNVGKETWEVIVCWSYSGGRWDKRFIYTFHSETKWKML